MSTDRSSQGGPLRLSEYKLDMERVEDVRGRGGSTQYLVKLAGGDRQPPVWLKSSLIMDRQDLVKEYHQRKKRERRAEIRRKRKLEISQTNNIHNYFKPLSGTAGRRQTDRLVSNSQPIRLSQYLLEKDDNRDEVPASSQQSPSVMESDAPAGVTGSSHTEHRATPVWAQSEQSRRGLGRSSDPTLPNLSPRAWPLVKSPRKAEPASAAAATATAAADGSGKRHCDICHSGGLPKDLYMVSVCGHMVMCNNCACSLFISLLQENCIVCNTVTLFVLNLFNIIQILASQLVESATCEGSTQ